MSLRSPWKSDRKRAKPACVWPRPTRWYATTRQSCCPLQQSIADETLRFYNGMLVGVYDLLLARQAQVQTARQYVSANKEFWLAWTDLERAVGGRLAVPASSPASVDAARTVRIHHINHGEQQP